MLKESENTAVLSQKVLSQEVTKTATLTPTSVEVGVSGGNGQTVVSPVVKIRKPLGGRVNVRPPKKLVSPESNQSIPKTKPDDFHQTYPINTAAGEGVYYILPVENPDTGENQDWIVVYEVVNAAVQQVTEQHDGTFSALTPKGYGLGGRARETELHPWVTRGKRFGLRPIKCALPDSTLSEEHYRTIREQIDSYIGKWYRLADNLVFPQPPGSGDWGMPAWPLELLEGNLDALVRRAYEGRIITSLEQDAAKWAAGLIGV